MNQKKTPALIAREAKAQGLAVEVLTEKELRRKHMKRQLEDVPSCRNCVEWAWWRPTPFRSYGNRPQE